MFDRSIQQYYSYVITELIKNSNLMSKTTTIRVTHKSNNHIFQIFDKVISNGTCLEENVCRDDYWPNKNKTSGLCLVKPAE